MKPYQQIPIEECGEPLLPIPLSEFVIEDPHPYVKLAAPYQGKSPYYLRRSVLERLLYAQSVLQRSQPDWRIQIFDAYRPKAVQQYMVDYTFAEAAKATAQAKGLSLDQLSAGDRDAILEQVYQFWAIPSDDPATPPPHSTGAAIDVTLADLTGQAIEMGAPIDEMSPRSYPDYFSESDHPIAYRNRQLLKQAMLTAGFRQNPSEWWHFSWGDQLWAWLVQQEDLSLHPIARYGAI
jgi:zinc D-Ala-D-Ala dipeptidase